MEWLTQVKIVIKKINLADPLSEYIPRLFKGKVVYAAIVFGILTVSLWWLVGSIVVSLYPNNYLMAPTNLDELSFGLFLWAIFVPILWWYYLSQPEMWERTAQSLCKEGVVEYGFLQVITAKLKRSFSLLSITITAVALFLYFYNSVPAEIASGRTSFWFVTPWSKVIEGLMMGVTGYIFINFTLKSFGLIWEVRKFFNQRGVKCIHIIHVDKSGGFGAIGHLAIQISSLTVVIGVWAVWYSFLPVISGGSKLNFSATVLALYAAYAVLAPLALLSLIVPASKAMKRYKHAMAAEASKKLHQKWDLILKNVLDNSTGSQGITETLEEYQELCVVFEEMGKTPEWPIRTLNLKRFTSVALFPALVGLLSFASDVLNLSTVVGGTFKK